MLKFYFKKIDLQSFEIIIKKNTQNIFLLSNIIIRSFFK